MLVEKGACARHTANWRHRRIHNVDSGWRRVISIVL